MKRSSKKRRLTSQKKLILIIDGVLVLGLIAAAVFLVVRLKSGGKQQAAAPAEPVGQTGQTAEAAEPAGTADMPQEAPVDTPAKDVESRYLALQQENVPVVAWISCDGTAIDYPVVSNLDDEYYTVRDVYGKKDKNGAIFLDGRNSAEFTDEQVILYGNPMADGSMFGSLVSYRMQDYYNAHPTLTLYTPAGSYTVRVFAAHLTSPARSNYPIWFESGAARAAYIQQACQQSGIASELTVPDDAKLISLVTSSDFESGENSRFVVHGYLEAIN